MHDYINGLSTYSVTGWRGGLDDRATAPVGLDPQGTRPQGAAAPLQEAGAAA